MSHACLELIRENEKLKTENEALKDLAAIAAQESYDYAVLLREAREWTRSFGPPSGKTIYENDLEARIDAALGEKP